MKIYFVRHGQTNYNLKHLCNQKPTKKVYLTELGKKQAQEVGEKLKSMKIDLIFVSELWRTQQTAEIINEFHDVEIKIDPRINDRKTGFEGRSVEEFYSAIEKDKFYIKPKGGESFQDEKERVFSFLKELMKLKYHCVLVVTHEEIMKIADGYFNKLSDEEMWKNRVENGEMMEFVI